MKKQYFTLNPNQTQKKARALAKTLLKTRQNKNAVVIGLVGDLGTGKTTFVQGFAKELGIKEKILSPTFVILKKFQITSTKLQINSKSKIQNLKHFYHIDCYRIQKPKEILDLRFKEIISEPKNIIIIEWANRIKKIMPRNTIWIKFDFINTKTRKIVIQ